MIIVIIVVIQDNCCNPPACRRVWLEGVVPVLFLASTCFFFLLLRVFASSESCPPLLNPQLPKYNK
jgi:hypothetical protein